MERRLVGQVDAVHLGEHAALGQALELDDHLAARHEALDHAARREALQQVPHGVVDKDRRVCGEGCLEKRVRVALALALLLAGVSADTVVETSTFYGACSEAKCINVFATFDETDGKCEDPYVRTILGATMSVTYASAAVADPSSIKLMLGSENYDTAVSGASTPCTAMETASIATG